MNLADARDLEWLTLVDKNGNSTGRELRKICHDIGLRHRAFSIILWDAHGKIVLQRRSRQKELWPGTWSNACCSHPRWQEPLEHAITRRLAEELNCHTPTRPIGSLLYRAHYHNIGIEHEYTHLYSGIATAISPNPEEVDGIKLIDTSDLQTWMVEEPQAFTPWFRRIWEQLAESPQRRLQEEVLR